MPNEKSERDGEVVRYDDEAMQVSEGHRRGYVARFKTGVVAFFGGNLGEISRENVENGIASIMTFNSPNLTLECQHYFLSALKTMYINSEKRDINSLATSRSELGIK